MRIGILTFWWSNDNYGQLLQCYALQKFLRDRGHEAFVIRYDYTSDIPTTPFPVRCLKAMNPARLLRFVLYKKHLRDVAREQKTNDRHFDDFRGQYIEWSEDTYPSYADLRGNPPEADAYIVGSDQVWNFGSYPFKRILGKLHAYMLDFGSLDTRRISYAASWSVTSLSKELIHEITPLLKKFDYVSVRERNGIALCGQCGCHNSEQAADPTMLLCADEYRCLYRNAKIRVPDRKYVLLYMLNNKHDFDIDSVYIFAEERSLDVIYVTGNGVIDGHKKFFATIEEWLYLVDNAEYVITNSFHCCVFSLIFCKHFSAIMLSGNHSRMNVRLESLWMQFAIKPRYITDSDFSVLDEDYTYAKMPSFPARLTEVLNAK